MFCKLKVVDDDVGPELLEIIGVHPLNQILNNGLFDVRALGLESLEMGIQVHLLVSILKYGDIVRSGYPPYNPICYGQLLERSPSKRAPSRKRSVPPDPTPLLLSSGLTPEEVAGLLQPYRFQDPAKADANLQAIAGKPQERQDFAMILGDVLSAVMDTADPDHALNQWDLYVQSGIHRSQLFQYLAQTPRMVQVLCTIFGNSPAMTQTLIRDPFARVLAS